jgi:hypothetical protein
MSSPVLPLVNQTDLTSSLFWIIYVLALVLSVVGVFVSNKLRHDREIQRFWNKVRTARKDPSSVWPYQEEEEE